MPRPPRLLRRAAVLLLAGPLAAALANAAPISLDFDGRTYQLRWSSQHQHEFTPAGQDDLNRWSDMITINTYPGVSYGDGLADVANGVLANYRRNGATALHTASLPRTADRPAEHLIVALFPTRTFIEAVFGRWRLTDGGGTAVIVSHRQYGQQAGEAMAAWLKAKGASVERSLMALDRLPSHRVLEPAGR